MSDNSRIVYTKSADPWWNLSVEEYLLNTVEPGQCILYLWQNENTVVIGRNQNPWRECRTQLLESEGGKLARRLSGGGAVYHDSGNLNFTFITSRELYDVDKQLEVVLGAVKSLGVEAERSGRNDLTADGRKFSGNAFCIRKNGAYHHGTLLVGADFGKLTKYLQVSPEKMRSKGVQSVQSRVVNLTELRPGLTVSEVADAMIASFRTLYGSAAQVEGCIKEVKENREALEELYCKYSSWSWRYGEAPEFDFETENRFSWGEIGIGFSLENGLVSKATVYSDAMDEVFIEKLPGVLKGCPFDPKQLAARLRHEADALDMAAISVPFRPQTRRSMTMELADWLDNKSF